MDLPLSTESIPNMQKAVQFLQKLVGTPVTKIELVRIGEGEIEGISLDIEFDGIFRLALPAKSLNGMRFLAIRKI